jgi:hypothetical protein
MLYRQKFLTYLWHGIVVRAKAEIGEKQKLETGSGDQRSKYCLKEEIVTLRAIENVITSQQNSRKVMTLLSCEISDRAKRRFTSKSNTDFTWPSKR